MKFHATHPHLLWHGIPNDICWHMHVMIAVTETEIVILELFTCLDSTILDKHIEKL